MTATMQPGTGGSGGVRRPAVAGAFYPAVPDELIRMIDADLAVAGAGDGETQAKVTEGLGHELALADDGDDAVDVADERPKAIIVPHAGYVYSGPVAASAYARLLPWRDAITRVVLLGPAHRVPVRSMALSSVDEWATPLGRVPVDAEGRAAVVSLPGVVVDDRPHAPEHSLEVEVPFLQRVLGEGFTLLPIVVGEADPDEVADVLDAVWGGDETLIVISSDLSHYHDYATARLRDTATAEHIVAGHIDEIGPYDACGAYPVRGMLAAAKRHGLGIELVDLRSSGDTAGPDDRVVGYGSFVLTCRVDAPDAGVLASGATGRVDDAVIDHHAGAVDADAIDQVGLPGADRLLATHGDAGLAVDAEGNGAADLGAPDDGGFTAEQERTLLDIATEAVRARLEDRTPVAMPDDRLDDRLRRPGATFVTLRDGERLLGCIGTLEARRPLVDDVAENALGAAFRDPRMPALTPAEFAVMSVHISVLTDPEPIPVSSHDELRRIIRPGEDGLLVEAGRHRGTFLPSVWEQLPDMDEFLEHLWFKAGMRPGTWPAHLQVSRYRAVEFGDDGPRDPIAHR